MPRGGPEAEAALRVDGVPEMVLEFAALSTPMREGIRQMIAAAHTIENGQGGRR